MRTEQAGFREDERWILVAHAGTNAVCIGQLLGLKPVPWAWERFVLHHTGLSRLRTAQMLGGRMFGLATHSDVAHLPREDRSR